MIWGWIAGCWRRFARWHRSLRHGRPWWVRMGVWAVTAVVGFVLYLVAVNINFLWLFGKSPTIHSIMHPKTNAASIIYSADGKEIGKFFDENRTPVPYDSINPEFFTVLIDTEDERFYRHHGIDYGGVLAAFKDMVVHGRPRGASTITQQLVKNMFRTRSDYSTGLLGYIPGVKMLIMKSKEWVLATEIEIFYSKREILEMYANTVEFGSNAYGIKTAARTYFDATPAQLKLQESAVLVGLLKATTAYNPRLNPKNALSRRNVVLSNMVSCGHLSQAARDSVAALPIELHYSVESPLDGEALYFRQAVARELEGWCQREHRDLNTDGLRIYTTLDTRMQRYAEQAVREKMRIVQQNFDQHWGDEDCWLNDDGQPIANFLEEKAQNTEAYRRLVARYPSDLDSVTYYMNQPHRVHLFSYDTDTLYREMSSMDSLRYMLHFMHAGFIAMEPTTGHIKAWVGDVDFDTWKYDKVQAMHQPGSTFKLFVYATAMEHGLTPCSQRLDDYIDTLVFNEHRRAMEHWRPTNSNGRFTGTNMTLRQAFAQSVNSVAVRLITELGVAQVAQTAREMGIRSPLDEKPALALGASDVNLVELVNGYCTVAAMGQQHEPVLVTRIEDAEGHVLYTAETPPPLQALSARSAVLMQRLLMAGRTDAGGTSMALNGYITPPLYDTDFGGKTGTSNRHADAWFVAVSPQLVCGAWVGGEYRQIHFRTGALGQGSRTALPICGAFLQRVFSDKAFKRYHGRFPSPSRWLQPSDYDDCYAEPDTTDLEADSLLLDSLGNPITPTQPDSLWVGEE